MTHNERAAIDYQLKARLSAAAAMHIGFIEGAKYHQERAAYFALRARQHMNIETDEG